eukprot:CAMPEP_0117671784 /NCGR_PEP_ID=MMETSP0804-20121206/13536_1 /TAXON_ID=1074897 /ORGANISM="Tetraselmis astigmatica, Strain CCMP880" /LENGTH=124 /DNA_ID=CAMNT_0005480303 /DNA_START=226 /DNA_END=600 /DNA_ORIENTATION=+
MGDIGPPCADAHIYIPQTAADTNQRRLVEPSAVYVNSVWLSFSAGGAKEILDSVADVHRVKAICLDALAVALKRHDAERLFDLHPNLVNAKKEKRHDAADRKQPPGGLLPESEREECQVGYQEA